MRETYNNELGQNLPNGLPHLSCGSHPPGSAEMCAMEAASWLAGETWSDHPRGVHHAVARVAREVNDRVPDEIRQTFWPLILCSVGTAFRYRYLPTTIFRTLLLERRATKSLALARISGDFEGAWVDLLNRYYRHHKSAESARASRWLPSPEGAAHAIKQGGDIVKSRSQNAQADAP